MLAIQSSSYPDRSTSERVPVFLYLTFLFAATLIFPPIMACILQVGLSKIWKVCWVCAPSGFCRLWCVCRFFVQFRRLAGLVEVEGLRFSALLGLLGWLGLEVFFGLVWLMLRSVLWVLCPHSSGACGLGPQVSPVIGKPDCQTIQTEGMSICRTCQVDHFYCVRKMSTASSG